MGLIVSRFPNSSRLTERHIEREFDDRTIELAGAVKVSV